MKFLVTQSFHSSATFRNIAQMFLQHRFRLQHSDSHPEVYFHLLCLHLQPLVSFLRTLSRSQVAKMAPFRSEHTLAYLYSVGGFASLLQVICTAIIWLHWRIGNICVFK